MKNWKYATQSDIDNMSVDEALEIVDRQILSGTTDVKITISSGSSPHVTKALKIIRKLAIDYIEHCMTEDDSEFFNRRYWLNLDTDQVRATDNKTELNDPYKEISKSLYFDLVKKEKTL